MKTNDKINFPTNYTKSITQYNQHNQKFIAKSKKK